jgi:hypothetical protein
MIHAANIIQNLISSSKTIIKIIVTTEKTIIMTTNINPLSRVHLDYNHVAPSKSGQEKEDILSSQ